MNKKLIYVLVGLIIIRWLQFVLRLPKDDAVALVKKQRLLQANGKDKLVAEINKPNGNCQGYVYVFHLDS